MASEAPNKPMPGGYRDVTNMEEEYPNMLKAAQFAVDQLKDGKSDQSYSFATDLNNVGKDTLAFKIVNAQQQVVAGMNYKLVLLLHRHEGNDVPPLGSCVGAFAVTVYDRFGTMSVTQWAKETDGARALAVLKGENATDNFAELY